MDEGSPTGNSAQPANGAFITISNLHKSYRTAAGQVQALENISWQVGKGEALALMGPSGCGKTTLLNLIGSMDRPTHGSIVVDGQELSRMTEREAEAYRLRKVGFVFQFFNLVPSLSARENLELPMVIAKLPKSERADRAQALLKMVGLGDKGHKQPEQLSGGEQQRVSICLALVNEPDIILADEPTGNLDMANMENITRLLVSLAAEKGKTVIVASHDQQMVKAFSKVYRMRDGSFERER